MRKRHSKKARRAGGIVNKMVVRAAQTSRNKKAERKLGKAWRMAA